MNDTDQSIDSIKITLQILITNKIFKTQIISQEGLSSASDRRVINIINNV